MAAGLAAGEDRLDGIAAATWANTGAEGPDPTPGRIRHLECELAALARRVEGPKRRRIERARAWLCQCARNLEAV